MRIIAGTHRNRAITCPKGWHVRPTAERLREAVFNRCQGIIEEARFLDLFAGTGAMGLEALSRGAAHATFVDRDRRSIQSIKTNLETLRLRDRATVLTSDVLKFLTHTPPSSPYTLVYVDPPYHKGGHPILVDILSALDEGSFLDADARIFLEDELKELDGTQWQTLQQVDERRYGRAILREFRLR